MQLLGEFDKDWRDRILVAIGYFKINDLLSPVISGGNTNRLWYDNLSHIPLVFRLLFMDITATLNEITSLSIKDRISLVQAIWDSIAAEQAYPDLTEPQKRELDRRIDDYEMNPDNVLTWEEIKASVRKQ